MWKHSYKKWRVLGWPLFAGGGGDVSYDRLMGISSLVDQVWRGPAPGEMKMKVEALRNVGGLGDEGGTPLRARTMQG
jgi:hypothetical protein